MGIYRDLPLRIGRIRDNNAHVVLTLRAGAVEVFEHGSDDSFYNIIYLTSDNGEVTSC